MFGHAGKDLRLSEGQRQAVMQAATAPVCILTGGPGCGKTTTTKYIVDLWKGLGKKLALCAPTGQSSSPSACFFYRVTFLLIAVPYSARASGRLTLSMHRLTHSLEPPPRWCRQTCMQFNCTIHSSLLELPLQVRDTLCCNQSRASPQAFPS